jgi:peptidoglycan hydrolase-like protein with peptidoglycan-binding domain
VFRVFAAILAVSLPASAASAVGSPSPAVSAITAPSINGATPSGANDKDPSLIAETEALLDRAHFSPGEIGGADGDNFRSAVHAFQEVNGLAVTAPKD